MGIIKSISKYGLALPVGIGNLITRGLEKVTKKDYGRTSIEEASQTTFGKVLGTSIVGTGVALGVAVAGVPAVIKAITPKTILGKGAGIVLAGAGATSPKVISAVLESPFVLFGAGKKIGTAVEELPAQVQEQAGDLGKYGLLGAGIGALATGLVGGIVIGGSEKAQEIKQEYFSPQPIAELPIISESSQPVAMTELPKAIEETATETPLSQITTPAEIIETGESKPRKRKKKALQPLRQTISQIVDVRVGVNSHNKKYIKNEIYN